MQDELRDTMRERIRVLDEDWQTKFAEVGKMSTKYVSGLWSDQWGGEAPSTPEVVRDVDLAKREMNEAREAERLAWEALLQAYTTLAESGLDPGGR